jgi:hypothetical protein
VAAEIVGGVSFWLTLPTVAAVSRFALRLVGVARATAALAVVWVVGAAFGDWLYMIHFDSRDLAMRASNDALVAVAVQNHCAGASP